MATTQTLPTFDHTSSLDSGNSSRRNPRQNAATGASAAGVRALSAQLVAFYFRAPIKAFFRTRVDYMAFARAVNPHSAKSGWSLHTTTPGLLVHAVRTYGWRFIPNQVMPPLLANAGIGAVLYTSYLQVLGALYEPASQGIKRVYPPAPPSSTFAAGLIAGTIQSIVAAPLDALQVRLRASDLLEGPYKSMWHYGRHKLNQIGVRGIFAGWGLSFTRDAFGYAVFFSFFEFVKSQAYYSFLTWYYGSRRTHYVEQSQHIQSSDRGFTWTDSGDLTEQFANAEDSLRIPLRSSEDRESSDRVESSVRTEKQNRVHYPSQLVIGEDDIEKIEIPCPPPRKISRAERLLAVIMSPNSRQNAQLHGLVGKPLLYFTSVFVSLGVFLFGYDQGVMSGIITGWYFKDYFNQPSRAAIGTVVAILEVGAFISSLLVGRIGDLIGRRKTILYGSIVFFIGGALQAFATGLPMMMAGRIVAGLGVGALSTIVPVYQSEISPPHNRGKLACIEFTGNISGYAASVWVDYFCSFIESNYSWRLPLLFQCVMGALLGVGSLLICESPRWLLDNDHDEEGMVVIANLYGSGDLHSDKARQEYREIKMNVLLQRQEGERSYTDMFRRYYKRVLIAMSAQALAQLNGINVISYYAPLVFESAGWAGRDAILMTGINAISYLASTVPPWYLVDRWGRRPILLSGAVAMIISLSLISYFIYIDVVATPTLTVIFVMIYNAAFGASWGPIPWLYPPEILPLSIRAKGASLSTATNWAFNWLVGEVTPVLQAAIKWRLYLVHAFFCACSFVLVFFLYPETSGVRLEDMNLLFGDATTAMPTPATQGERGSLMSAGSPVPSLDIRRQYGRLGADSAIPGLEIDPPNISSSTGSKPGRTGFREDSSSRPEGFGGWISNMITRHKGSESTGQGGQYRRLGQGENE
ncbi:Ribosome associated membrane protein RAMP4 family protein [Aspergillus niger]|uniref:Ribosome associated membrane protein RAMP4 family protein n=1 Tax=Aspergillus niger TaxID=5061 RepID=A0A505IBV2_ASPNG|nr:Ribosome associated membrane protein RAMP4 family protein [Aspergillus niger]